MKRVEAVISLLLVRVTWKTTVSCCCVGVFLYQIETEIECRTWQAHSNTVILWQKKNPTLIYLLICLFVWEEEHHADIIKFMKRKTSPFNKFLFLNFSINNFNVQFAWDKTCWKSNILVNNHTVHNFEVIKALDKVLTEFL